MDDPGGPWHDDEEPARHSAPARRTLPDLVAEAAWSYRAAPLATRVTVDLVALAVLLVLTAGGAYLLLRDPGGPGQAAASATSTSWSSTTAPPSTTAPSTTTTLPPAPPTTAAPTTTTTVRPTTTAPPAPPPTAPPPVAEPPAPPPTPPDTSGRRPYRSCSEALMDGALPLYRGEPGYNDRLDHDGDGEACEWGDGF